MDKTWMMKSDNNSAWNIELETYPWNNRRHTHSLCLCNIPLSPLYMNVALISLKVLCDFICRFIFIFIFSKAMRSASRPVTGTAFKTTLQLQNVLNCLM